MNEFIVCSVIIIKTTELLLIVHLGFYLLVNVHSSPAIHQPQTATNWTYHQPLIMTRFPAMIIPHYSATINAYAIQLPYNCPSY